jgi:hypothetical protein
MDEAYIGAPGEQATKNREGASVGTTLALVVDLNPDAQLFSSVAVLPVWPRNTPRSYHRKKQLSVRLGEELFPKATRTTRSEAPPTGDVVVIAPP